MSLKCVSNLRQFYAAEVLYANDYKGTVPGNGRSPSWTRMPAFFNELTQSSNRQSAAEMVLCPTCPNTADLFTETLSYGSDGWIKLYDTPDATNVLFAGDTYANPEGPNSSTTYLFAETASAVPKVWFGHVDTANLLMADGHVASMKRQEIPTFNDVLGVRYPGYKKFWLGLSIKP